MDVHDKIEDLKRLLLQAHSVMIIGADFIAFNYGDGKFADGRDSLVSGTSGHARIDRKTGTWSFRPEALSRIPEASHFDATHEHTDLTFNQLKAEIEKDQSQ